MQIKSHRNNALRKGFTFIELIITLAIGVLLASIAIPSYNAIMERAKVRKAEASMQNMKTAMLQYNVDVGGYPRTLRELVTRPTDERGKKWRGPYMEEVPEDDPWGNPYVYRITPGQRNPYELYSTGSKGAEAAKEDRLGTWN